MNDELLDKFERILAENAEDNKDDDDDDDEDDERLCLNIDLSVVKFFNNLIL
jgi:hypothetical protein